MFLNLHKKIVGWFVSLEQDCIFRQLWSSRHTDDPVAELKEKKEDRKDHSGVAIDGG